MAPFQNEWTTLEKLLLTQSVFKYGENMWFQVARVIKQHELIQQQGIQRPSDFYSQKNCSFQYYLLVESLEAEKQAFRNDLKNDMPAVVRLARQLYSERVQEIKTNLQNQQKEFDQLAQDIYLIKSGQVSVNVNNSGDTQLKRTVSDLSIQPLVTKRYKLDSPDITNEDQVISTAIQSTLS